MDTEANEKRCGQAMIEVIAGLVTLIVLTAAIAQLAVFARAGNESIVRAREQAGMRALLPFQLSNPARYIGATGPGPDQRPYTRDDIFASADTIEFYRGLLDPLVADPSEWHTLDAIPGNHFSRLRNSVTPIGLFGLIEGASRETIPLLPAVRSLLYRDDSILVEETVWMPWTKGVY